MIKSKKVFLFVFAFTFVGLSISLFLALNSIRGRYSLLNQVEKIPFEHRVQGINFDKRGNMWVSNSGSLYQYKDGLLIKEYQKNSVFRERGPNTIVFDDKGQIWVATAPQEVAVLNKGQWTTIYAGGSRVKRILSFSLDPNGNAWIGIEGEGIKVFDKTGEILNTYDVSNSILDSNGVVDIKFDGHGVAWISTWADLYSFDGNEWKTYDVDGGKIAFDHSNHIWVGDVGISVFDGVDWINYDPGASSIFNIAFDHLGRVWILSAREPCELCMFDGKTWKYYYPKDQHDHFGYVSAYFGDALATDNDRNVWFVPSDGDGAYQISSDFPMFTLFEWNFLYFAGKGAFPVLLIILVNLWFVFAVQSWRNIGSGIVVGMLVCMLGIVFFHVDAWSVSNPGIFVTAGGIIGGFFGRVREKIGAERAGVVKGLIIAFAIWWLLSFCYAIIPML